MFTTFSVEFDAKFDANALLPLIKLPIFFYKTLAALNA
jgi:hypothetical protein